MTQIDIHFQDGEGKGSWLLEDAHYQGGFGLWTGGKDYFFFHGEGEMTLADKTVIKGEYWYGEPNGWMEITYSSGRVNYELWKYGKFLNMVSKETYEQKYLNKDE